MVKNEKEKFGLLKFAPVCMLLVMLGGCSLKQEPKKQIEYIEKPVYVNVPVMETPKLKPIPKPTLEISKLTDTSSSSEVAEAYYNSLKQLIHHNNLLEKQLSPFYKEYKRK